ncbi:hypothetical protein [Microterricola viridarii]|uniref:Uncharacterized protein n=1 Tax=Microterricola viridarii TaxID=412690 RepID=A0A120I1D3_9MICO|nr:hypothetical protein [Microterricola viridarii]AMB60017.1 hypothetical protein AWU67_15415 [Microterricola viridarii]
MRNPRASRALRGAVAAAFSTFVALLSHLAGGGETPGAWGIITPLVLSTLLCVFLSGQRLSLPRLSASVAISQLLFHALFVLGTTTAAAAQLSAHAGHAGSAADQLLAAPGMVGAQAAGVEHLHGGMWLAHAAAALLTIAALHRGETVLVGLAQFAGFVIARVTPTVAVPLGPVAPSAHPSAVGAGPWLQQVLLSLGYFPSTTLRRGPPAGACSA